MLLGGWFALVLLIVMWGAQVFRRSLFLRCLAFIVPASAVVIFGLVVHKSFLQYEAWQAGGLSERFLPPYTPWSYFLGYVGTRFAAPWLIALLAAVVLPRIAEHLNRRFGERFFEKEEPQLFGAGIFLTGYPGFLFYIILILFFGFLLSTFYSLLSKGRAPLYFLWLPVAVFVIMVENWLIPPSLLSQFNL